MTQDQLEGFIAVARRNPDGMGPKTTMVVQLADERDAAIRQRDRALALLRDAPISRCKHYYTSGWDYSGPCAEGPPCPEHRRRALLAEVDAT